VSTLPKATRRAQRLLRAYPLTWRQRYGSEFVDLIEQEIADTPHRAKRTANIFYKGSLARLGEAGIVGPTLNPLGLPRVALGRPTLLASVFTVFALYFWSFAMLAWNSAYRWPASTAVSVWTGAITVCFIALVVLVAIVSLSFLWHALGRAVAGRVKRVLVPLLMRVRLSCTCIPYTRPSDT
jgi:hypothetical protein